MSQEALLRELYNDPKTGYQGVEALYRRAKEVDPEMTRKMVRDWLQAQLSYTLHRPARRNLASRRVFVSRIDDQWQSDLVVMEAGAAVNGGMKYILTIIDILSKYAWAIPLRTKSADDVLSAFKKATQHRQPEKLQTDEGKEFINRKFQDWLETKDIEWFHTYSDRKASVIERWNRTLKNMMYKYFTAENTHVWIDVLDLLVENYNSTEHSSIGMKPVEVTEKNDHIAFLALYGDRFVDSKPAFAVGESVRISKYRSVFKKGYLPSWSEEIFTVRGIVYSQPIVYRIKDLRGEDVLGTFYGEELQRVTTDSSTVYRVEKILKTKKVRRRGVSKKLFLVKWQGYSDFFNSWEPEENIIKRETH